MANDAVVTSAVAAASALKDQFVHLKNYKDGALIITSADRSDLMLGLRVSRVPGVLPNILAIILTNGILPYSNTQEILKGGETLGKDPDSWPPKQDFALHKDFDLLEKYVDYFHTKRKHKGVTKELARDYCKDETYFGILMVLLGNADGVVSGACHTIANTIRPALQLIKTTPNRPNVSSIFFICLEDGVRIYGDCAVNTDPSAQDLAQIAVTSAESAEAFGLIPKVALLSYATGDSNSGPIVDKVREATKIAQELRPDLDIYGPIQYDAAVDEAIAKTKLKAIPSGAKVGGQADLAIRKRKADAVASKSS